MSTSDQKDWRTIVAWMRSYERFTKDKETTQEIFAMTKRNRPIQAATVVGRLRDAIQLVHPIDLGRLEESVASRGINVTGNPETSGLHDGGKHDL